MVFWFTSQILIGLHLVFCSLFLKLYQIAQSRSLGESLNLQFCSEHVRHLKTGSMFPFSAKNFIEHFSSQVETIETLLILKQSVAGRHQPHDKFDIKQILKISKLVGRQTPTSKVHENVSELKSNPFSNFQTSKHYKTNDKLHFNFKNLKTNFQTIKHWTK